MQVRRQALAAPSVIKKKAVWGAHFREGDYVQWIGY